MNFKKLTALLLSCALLLSLAGCAPKAQAAPVPEAAPAAAPVEEKVKLDPEMEVNYVTVEWLKENLDKVIILDANADKAYKAGHIPGAVNVTWQSLSNMAVKQGEPGWGVVLGKDELAKKLGQFGIDGSKDIIVYNDPKGMGEEGRVLWMLRIAGLNNSKMLYGGIPAWQAAGNEVSTEVATVTPVSFTIAAYDYARIATTDFVKENLKTLKILDTRSPEEYTGASNHGENYKGEKALGHIEGAISLPYSELYNIDGTPKSIADMKAIFEGLGLKVDDEIVTYCTVGIRSGFTAEELRMCGYTKAKNYNGSFSEWAGAGQPFVK